MKIPLTLTEPTSTREQAAAQRDNGPVRTRAGRLNEIFARWISNSTLGARFAHWLSRTISLPQLRRLTVGEINLVFPIERLRELEAEHVIGRLAENHYGFGLMGSAKKLMPSIKEVARRISESGVDLALLVPA